MDVCPCRMKQEICCLILCNDDNRYLGRTIFGKYDPGTDYRSGKKIGTRGYCDEKQVAHPYWLLIEVI